MPSRPVTALYVRRETLYRFLPGVACYDVQRDARTYYGPHPVITHPPCGPWSNLAAVCYQDKDAAPRAADQVRSYGGVLEHPAWSRLWKHVPLPYPGGGMDAYGGFTVQINQCRFGHRALKPTWLYIVGLDPRSLPPMPAWIEPARQLRGMSEREREETPLLFAQWLVRLARKCDYRLGPVPGFETLTPLEPPEK